MQMNPLNYPRKKMALLTLAVVICLSFLVGLSIGFSRTNVREALAYQVAGNSSPKHIVPVVGMKLAEVGRASKLGGVETETYSFTSPHSVDDLLEQQESLWKQRGFRTFGMKSPTRGVMLAEDKITKERYQTVAFFCPPAVRGQICNGDNSFGVTSYLASGTMKHPDLPQCQGMQISSSFESFDRGRPTETLSGVCPGDLLSAAESFRTEFLSQGFQQLGAREGEFGLSRTKILIFAKDREELTVVLSEAPSKQMTMAIITRES
jgi:hypothetical protein